MSTFLFFSRCVKLVTTSLRYSSSVSGVFENLPLMQCDRIDVLDAPTVRPHTTIFAKSPPCKSAARR